MNWYSPGDKLTITLVIGLAVIVIAAAAVGTIFFFDDSNPVASSTSAPSNPIVNLEPKIGRVGSQVAVRGQGWPAGRSVLIYLLPSDQASLPNIAATSAVVDPLGSFTTGFIVPPDPAWKERGQVVVVAQTEDGGLSGRAVFGLEAEAAQLPTPRPALPSPSPTATLAPQSPQLQAETDLNIWSGPGVGYPVLGLLASGQSADITGISVDGNWWQIRFAGAPDGRGWLAAQYVSADNVSAVPVIEAPPLPATATPTAAPTPDPTPLIITEWRAEYYDQANLSNDPALVRNDPAIDFVWGLAAPVPGLPVDDFSVRWSRNMAFEPGLYRFHLAVDDGARLWIDGQLLIDTWREGDARELTAEYALDGGRHQLRLEYFNQSGNAEIGLWWDTVTTPFFADWQAEYWSNQELSGSPIVVRNDPAIDFNWGTGAPLAGLPASNFSARWSRWITFVPGTYRFSMRADDGIRFYVDDGLVLNEWRSSEGNETYTVDLQLAGSHHLVVEYYELIGSALAQFRWAPINPTSTATASPSPTVTPTPTPIPPTHTPTTVPTATPQPTHTPLPTSTPVPPTSTVVPTQTPIPTSTATHTPTPTSTGTPTQTPTATSSPTFTPTSTGTPTQTPTLTATTTTTPTITATPTLIPTVGPMAEFAANPVRGTVPLTVTVSNSSTNAGSYVWNFGDGSIPVNSLNPSHTYTQAGVFTVTLAASDGVLTDTLSRPNYIKTFGPADLQAGFTAAPISGTIPLTVTMVNSSISATTYLWDFGDGAVSTSAISPTHIYTQAGIYTVTLAAGNGVLTDTLVRAGYISIFSEN